MIFNNLRGLDRIVPIGKSMDMDIIWDGYDVINQLSRQLIFQSLTPLLGPLLSLLS